MNLFLAWKFFLLSIFLAYFISELKVRNEFSNSFGETHFNLSSISDSWRNCLQGKLNTDKDCRKKCLASGLATILPRKIHSEYSYLNERVLSSNISCHGCPYSTEYDTLFHYLEEQQIVWNNLQNQSSHSWGTILDVGSGDSSLRWILSLKPLKLAAVTASSAVFASLRRKYGHKLKTEDMLLLGNWMIPNQLKELEGQKFDVVLVDYVFAAMEPFSPFQQEMLLERLRGLVNSRIYIIGQEPYRMTYDANETSWENTVQFSSEESFQHSILFNVMKLRDLCQLIAGTRFYREFPVEWVVKSLENSGFIIDDVRAFPIVWGKTAILKQIEICDKYINPSQNMMIDYSRTQSMIYELKNQMETLNKIVMESEFITKIGSCFGMDYIISAHIKT